MSSFSRPALAALSMLIAFAGEASATLSQLSRQPAQATLAECRRWADSQTPDAIESWGMKPDGASSREVALMRLVLNCLGDARPEIVGATSSAGARRDYCESHADVGLCRPRPAAGVATGFVFEAGGASTPESGQRVGVGDRVPPQVLRSRFNGYAVRIARGEDCIVCATVSGKAGTLEVNFKEDGRTVMMLSSEDPRATDKLGNRVGGPLVDAVGGSAVCDNGMMLTCDSTKLQGLSYIVAEDPKCKFDTDAVDAAKGKKPVPVPACAKIGGFIAGSNPTKSSP